VTREHKLALVVGFSLVLVVGVLISDHFSKARAARVSSTSAGDPVPAVQVAYEPTRPNPLPQPNASIPAQPTDPAASLPAADPPPPAILYMTPPSSKPSLDGMASATPDAAALGPLPRNSAGPGEPVSPPFGRDPDSAPPLVVRPDLSPTPPTPTPAAPSLPVSRDPLQRHEVVKGDTIYRIAGDYYGDRSLWKQLQAFNKGRIAADGTLRIGATLLIPPRDVLLGKAALPADARAAAPNSPDPRAGTAKPAPVNDKPAKPSPPPSTYTVQAGDTLARIAARTLGDRNRWQQIRDLNADTLEDEDTLTVGQRLRLPTR
jgi:LysM repeat protein